jgi:hypothetical protein
LDNPDNILDAIVQRLLLLEADDVLIVGNAPAALRFHWTNASESMVITARQRSHYLIGHPEIGTLEQDLVRTLIDPDAIFRNRDDPLVAILVRALPVSGMIRAAVLTTTRAGYHNSLISAWRMRSSDYRRLVKSGRRVWERA